MSVLIGLHKDIDREMEIVQDGASVSIQKPGGISGARSIIEKRDGVIGNGPTAGEGVFDFRYGPFTGGYPEAGIVHYYTYGERILSVEIDLSNKHRGIEASLAGKSVSEAGALVAGLCGNFAAAHTVAYARAVESALNVEVPEAVQRFRIAAIEIERIYNHLYVIMRLANAAAQKVLAAHLGALFEDAMRISAALTGTRGIGAAAITADEIPSSAGTQVANRVGTIRRTFAKLHDRSLASRNYLDRLHGTSIVRAQGAQERGLTGPSLRACGIGADLRSGESLISGFKVRTKTEADAFARMETRAEEIFDACQIVIDQIGQFSSRNLSTGKRSLADQLARHANDGSHRVGFGAVESPSGTVAWLVCLDGGTIGSASVSSPSVFGFQAYADAVVGNIFTDVPFAIESFGVNFADAGR
ncbi:MAG TPA: nickel-dependent hydrogenase large subunit [Spirochaetia bacterium]|nr:nickel-dependent hydrogenase large subunit [Spirochaetia bacterium]